MKRIAVVTSGGDAPGMNAAVNAIYWAGTDQGMEVYGIRRGYEGLIEGDMYRLSKEDVEDITQMGGTFLETARCLAFTSVEEQLKAISNLKKNAIEGLIVVGGNGSQCGSYAIHRHGFPVVGVASTVDNDLYGSDTCIGVDTALNTIIESIDKIRTTAESHRRAFLIQVMGRDYGYLAIMSGIASGADVIVTPEFEKKPKEVAEELHRAHERGKRYALALITDGAKNNAEKISKYINEHSEKFDFELRVTILGHVQRGGSPSVYDRYLAARLGAGAVELLAEGGSGKLAGWINHDVAFTPLDEVVSRKKELDPRLWKLARLLAG